MACVSSPSTIRNHSWTELGVGFDSKRKEKEKRKLKLVYQWQEKIIM